MKRSIESFNYKQLVAFLILIIYIVTIPIEAFAHDAYFLQVLIDEHTMQYYGAVVTDRASLFSNEAKHVEAKLGDFQDIKNFKLSPGVDYSKLEPKKVGAPDVMVFTFPPKEHKRWNQKALNHASQKDSERAYEIRDLLIPNLNEILHIVSDGKGYKDVDELIKTSEKINGSNTTINGWSLSYSGDNVTVSKGMKKYTFIYKTKKGYKSSKLSDGRPSPVYSSKFDYSDDINEISIKDLIVQANYAAKEQETFAESAGKYNKPNTAEKILAEVVTATVNNLRNALNLYDLSDLVYNQNIRGDNHVFKGALPHEWMNIAVAFHLIFQAIAWTMLAAAFVKLIFMKNLSTMNPAMRVSLIDGIKDFMLTALLLATNLVLITSLMEFNIKIVDVFAQTIPEYGGFMGGMNADYQTLAGSLLQFYYLFITIYFNGVYIYRSLVLAILIASGPYFIIKIAFGGRNKQSFSIWWSELIGNIFLQAFHAFILSVFLSVQMASRGIVTALLAFSLIPLTKFFRSLMLGGGGGFAESMGGAGAAGATGLILGGMNSMNNLMRGTQSPDNRTNQTEKSMSKEASNSGQTSTTSESSTSETGPGNVTGQDIEEKSRQYDNEMKSSGGGSSGYANMNNPLMNNLNKVGNINSDSDSDVLDSNSSPNNDFATNVSSMSGGMDINNENINSDDSQLDSNSDFDSNVGGNITDKFNSSYDQAYTEDNLSDDSVDDLNNSVGSTINPKINAESMEENKDIESSTQTQNSRSYNNASQGRQNKGLGLKSNIQNRINANPHVARMKAKVGHIKSEVSPVVTPLAKGGGRAVLSGGQAVLGAGSMMLTPAAKLAFDSNDMLRRDTGDIAKEFSYNMGSSSVENYKKSKDEFASFKREVGSMSNSSLSNGIEDNSNNTMSADEHVINNMDDMV